MTIFFGVKNHVWALKNDNAFIIDLINSGSGTHAVKKAFYELSFMTLPRDLDM